MISTCVQNDEPKMMDIAITSYADVVLKSSGYPHLVGEQGVRYRTVCGLREYLESPAWRFSKEAPH